MIEVDAEARSAAPPERVWALLADPRSWTRWAGFDEVHVEGGEGVGEVRQNRRGRITGRYRVVVFEAPHRYAYESTSALPVRDYRGDVTLHPRRMRGHIFAGTRDSRPRFRAPGGSSVAASADS